jgi:hypothetical protein
MIDLPGKPRCAKTAPFDFTGQMRHLAEDFVARLPELAHIDLSRVLLCFCQARNGEPYGMFASLTPLRFAGGSPIRTRRGQVQTIESVRDSAGREMLYILSFYLPRFQNLPLREKLITVLHELWHISPSFNGDIRRHAGRYHAHTHSQAEYDEAATTHTRIPRPNTTKKWAASPIAGSRFHLQKRFGAFCATISPRSPPATAALSA